MSVEQLVGPDAVLVTPDGGVWHLGLVRRGRFLITTLWFENAPAVFGESVWTARRRFIPDDLQVEVRGPGGDVSLRLVSARTSERISTVLFQGEPAADTEFGAARLLVRAPGHGLAYSAAIGDATN